MKNSKSAKANTETQLLELLKRVLPKATDDPSLAGRIYEAVEAELRKKTRTTTFDKFCSRVPLPDLEAKSLEDVKRQIGELFGDADVTLKPDKKEKLLAVEVDMPDGTQFRGEIMVNNQPLEGDVEQEIKLKFSAFPVCTPGDKELIWLLGKREDLTTEEAGMALSKVEDDFWASKGGQKLLRDRVERIFPEFIARVPAGMLGEAGLKRHYKLGEALRVMRSLRK